MKTKISTQLVAKLKFHAFNARRNVITASSVASSSHIASALSPIDILTALYFDTLNVNHKDPDNPKRDKFILSKGHGGLGLYSVLVERGFISEKLLKKYGQDGSVLTVHPVRKAVAGIEATTGSLGHGLGMGVGMAIAQKRNKNPGRVFVMVSDGECDEGSTWEAVMLAGHWQLDNLVAIVDYNKIQSFGSVKEVLELEPFADKWQANRWAVTEVDGHDFEKLIPALRSIPLAKNKPTVIIAHTVKGKGVPFMENKLEWHYRNVRPEDLKVTLGSLY